MRVLNVGALWFVLTQVSCIRFLKTVMPGPASAMRSVSGVDLSNQVFEKLLWRERQTAQTAWSPGTMPLPGVKTWALKLARAGVELKLGQVRGRGLLLTWPLLCRPSQGATCTC